MKSQSKPDKIPFLCIAGFSGSGKTTLMVSLIAHMKSIGLRVGTIKHDVHGFNIDKPGKDSYRHKAAGAEVSMISSPNQIAMVMDSDHDHSLAELLPMFTNVDIVLVEGFKGAPVPKIEIFRKETGNNPACMGDPDLIAVVSDNNLSGWGIRQFATKQIKELTDFILNHLGFAQK